METYDLVVIGSGTGLSVLNVGLQAGMKCALVEDTKLGGTCLTRGCITSKVLVHPADLIRKSQHAKKIGIKFNVEEINWDFIAERMWSQINESNMMEHGLSKVPNLKLYKGVGEFTGEYEMKVYEIGALIMLIFSIVLLALDEFMFAIYVLIFAHLLFNIILHGEG